MPIRQGLSTWFFPELVLVRWTRQALFYQIRLKPMSDVGEVLIRVHEKTVNYAYGATQVHRWLSDAIVQVQLFFIN